MRLRMRSYILVPFGVLVAVTVLGVTALNVDLAGRRTRAQLESRLQNVMDTLATSNFPLTDSVLRQMRGLSGAEFAVADQTGQIRSTSRDPIWISGALRSLAEAPPAADAGHQQIRWDGQDYVVSVVSLQRPAHGSERLHILFPDRLFRDAWWEAAVAPLLLGGLVLIVSSVMVAVLATRVTRPIHGLRQQVTRIADGDFTALPMPNHVEELVELSDAINQMANRLSVYQQQVRRTEGLRLLDQLAGGMAHQLRNYATGARMALDLHARDCPMTDETLEVARRQLILIEEYLRRFLATGPTSLVMDQLFECQGWLQETIGLLRPAAHHGGVQLDWEQCDQLIQIQGDRLGLQQVLLNVLMNAIEAASDGGLRRTSQKLPQDECLDTIKGRVVVRECPHDAGMVRIEVRDNGPGPNLQTAGEIFEPMVSTKTSGVGLGLAVCRDIMRQHQGTIDWERETTTDCTLFTLVIPALIKESPHVAVVGR